MLKILKNLDTSSESEIEIDHLASPRQPHSNNTDNQDQQIQLEFAQKQAEESYTREIQARTELQSLQDNLKAKCLKHKEELEKLKIEQQNQMDQLQARLDIRLNEIDQKNIDQMTAIRAEHTVKINELQGEHSLQIEQLNKENKESLKKIEEKSRKALEEVNLAKEKQQQTYLNELNKQKSDYESQLNAMSEILDKFGTDNQELQRSIASLENKLEIVNVKQLRLESLIKIQKELEHALLAEIDNYSIFSFNSDTDLTMENFLELHRDALITFSGLDSKEQLAEAISDPTKLSDQTKELILQAAKHISSEDSSTDMDITQAFEKLSNSDDPIITQIRESLTNRLADKINSPTYSKQYLIDNPGQAKSISIESNQLLIPELINEILDTIASKSEIKRLDQMVENLNSSPPTLQDLIGNDNSQLQSLFNTLYTSKKEQLISILKH